MGGAIQVTSNPAELGDDSGYIETTVGNFGDNEFTGYVNHAFSDDLAGRFSFAARNRDGYSKNVFLDRDQDDHHSLSGRGQLNWQPTANLDAQLLLSWTHLNDGGLAAKFIGPGGWAAEVAAATNNDPWKDYADQEGYTKDEIGAAVLHVNWTTDYGTLESISGLHTMHSHIAYDVDSRTIPLYYPNDNCEQGTGAEPGAALRLRC